MQLDLLLDSGPQKPIATEVIQVGARTFPLKFVRNPRAKRYVLRLSPDGAVRITIPRGGSRDEGMKLAHRNHEWLEKQFHKRNLERERDTAWENGTRILFRGERVPLWVSEKNAVRLVSFGDQSIVADVAVTDLRPIVEQHLWNLARQELAGRALHLAGIHSIEVIGVTVRNQRSRWGSCSRQKTISLNWRLIQMPESVSDYIILHELAHVRHMNHSTKYWKEVARLCPGFERAEDWLKQHGRELR